jgi:hypothetical protein
VVSLLLLPLGFVLGVAVGRWWTLALAVAIGVAAGFLADVGGLAAWLVAVLCVASTALGVAAGVAMRQWIRRLPERRSPPGKRPVKGEATSTAAAEPRTEPESPEPGRPVAG